MQWHYFAWQADSGNSLRELEHLTAIRNAFRNHLFTFDEGELQRHENLMPCVIVGIRNPVVVVTDNDSSNAEVTWIRPGVPHRVSFGQGGAEIMYLDGVGFDTTLPEVGALSQDWKALPEFFESRNHEALLEFRRKLEGKDTPSDPAVMAVVQRLYDDPFLRLSQNELANEIGLERTQALRHFKATTGQTFRKFKIWAGILAAAHAGFNGEKFGIAGIESGFSDGAHLARTAGEVFGITPTQGLSGLRRFISVPGARG
ncbi:hypothetical protein RA28_00670 [Ruegeria sp. ANG-S4]|nr:hypothetical protein RA28_00670 [Ruegeria sp. ANG-S4]